MRTSKKQALKFYKVVEHCDPFTINSFDKVEYIKSYVKMSFKDNLKYLLEFINEAYTIEEIKQDKFLFDNISELLATYIIQQTIHNTNYYIGVMSVEDIEITFNIKIDFDIYENICNILEKDKRVLDVNNTENEYYFNSEKQFNINYFGIYTDEEEEE
jgi:hypothetical protein